MAFDTPVNSGEHASAGRQFLRRQGCGGRQRAYIASQMRAPRWRPTLESMPDVDQLLQFPRLRANCRACGAVDVRVSETGGREGQDGSPMRRCGMRALAAAGRPRRP
jgi:hypothetical protein